MASNIFSQICLLLAWYFTILISAFMWDRRTQSHHIFVTYLIARRDYARWVPTSRVLPVAPAILAVWSGVLRSSDAYCTHTRTRTICTHVARPTFTWDRRYSDRNWNAHGAFAAPAFLPTFTPPFLHTRSTPTVHRAVLTRPHPVHRCRARATHARL